MVRENSDLKIGRLEFRLTNAEKKALEQLAERRGTSMGDVLRSMIRRAAGRTGK